MSRDEKSRVESQESKARVIPPLGRVLHPGKVADRKDGGLSQPDQNTP